MLDECKPYAGELEFKINKYITDKYMNKDKWTMKTRKLQ